MLHDFSCWKVQDWVGCTSIVVLDLFGLNPVEYRPFLLGHLKSLAKVKQVVCYHSHLQDEEVPQHLRELEQKDGHLELQIWPEYPLEVISEKDEKAMLDGLSTFLREDREHPEKQDVVIFYPPNIHLRKFSGKLAEHLSKQHLKEQTCIICKPGQPQPSGKNCVFLVQNAKQLSEWDYDYSKLFYALDYKLETSFYYDYHLHTYVHKIAPSSGLETAKRMTFINSTRIGRYASLPLPNHPNSHYLDSCLELSAYALKMVALGAGSYCEQEHPRLKACLKTMEDRGIIQRDEKSFRIKDEQVLSVAEEGVSPMEACMVLEVMRD